MLHAELRRNKHVMLETLWSEYVQAHPDGYRYSRFCELYPSWEKRLPVTMRQTHSGGDKLFIDYAGDKLAVIVDRRSGKTQDADRLHPEQGFRSCRGIVGLGEGFGAGRLDSD